MTEAVLLLHAAATWFMTGLIWFVQLVHYPLFAGVGAERFETYAYQHVQRTTWIVAPAMLIEAVSAAWLCVVAAPTRSSIVWWVSIVLLLGIWVSTAALQVPDHRRLGKGFDAVTHHRLVITNWARTAAWSIRGVMVGWIVWGIGSSV